MTNDIDNCFDMPAKWCAETACDSCHVPKDREPQSPVQSALIGLLGCPFCGEDPEREKEGVWHRILCTNSKCHFAPATKYNTEYMIAVDKWQKRAN